MRSEERERERYENARARLRRTSGFASFVRVRGRALFALPCTECIARRLLGPPTTFAADSSSVSTRPRFRFINRAGPRQTFGRDRPPSRSRAGPNARKNRHGGSVESIRDRSGGSNVGQWKLGTNDPSRSLRETSGREERNLIDSITFWKYI